MAKPNKMSRRDWFRLRTQNLPTTTTDDSRDKFIGESAGKLVSMKLPPNHDGMDLSELPPMREATLDRDDLDALFSDIANLANEVSLIQRLDSNQAVKPQYASKDNLLSAKTALLAERVTRLQIRYRWNETLWIDTLSKTSSGFQLIRIAHASTG